MTDKSEHEPPNKYVAVYCPICGQLIPVCVHVGTLDETEWMHGNHGYDHDEFEAMIDGIAIWQAKR